MILWFLEPLNNGEFQYSLGNIKGLLVFLFVLLLFMHLIFLN